MAIVLAAIGGTVIVICLAAVVAWLVRDTWRESRKPEDPLW